MMSHINLCMIRNKKPYICGGYHNSYFKPDCKEDDFTLSERAVPRKPRLRRLQR